MQLPSYLPPSIQVVVGTRDLADEAGRTRPGAAYLIEPPVDTSIDRPGLDTGAFAARFGLAEPENGACTTVAIVTRVARHMKQESIERSMDAVARLARQ